MSWTRQRPACHRAWLACVLACSFVGFSTPTGAQGVSFVDVTSSAGIVMTFFLPAEPIPGGGAVGDFNNDGFQDIFILGGWQGDRLYVNNGDGSFTDATIAWGLDWAHWGHGVAVGDYNDDGWLDMYVTSFGTGSALGQHRLYRNEAGTHFTKQTIAAGVNMTSTVIPDGFGSAFGDYDLDGDLDLFVGGWYPGDGNRLFQNQGNGTFVDVTALALGTVTARTFSPRFVDMDGDFYPELLLAADFGTSRYYVNNGMGSFLDQTVASGTGLDANGMGNTIGDYNGDGRLDWYVTSVHSPVFIGASVPGSGNMLYMQQGLHSYSENATSAGVSDGGWGWGALSVDFDHDGDVDIIETNGWEDPEWQNESSYAYLNDGTGNFTDASIATGIANHTLQGRGIAALDIENDGDQDVFILCNNGPPRLYRCDLTGTDQHWLRILLNTTGSALAPNGFGSRVRIRVGGVEQLRSIDGGSNYMSQSELTAHFGVGPATVIDQVRVEWSNGIVSVLHNVPADQTLTLSPGRFTFSRGDCNADGAVNVTDAVHALAHVFGSAPLTPCLSACDANGDGVIDLSDPVLALQALFIGPPAATFGECVYGGTAGGLPCSAGLICP